MVGGAAQARPADVQEQSGQHREPRSVAIIGGGISGLAAAFLLRDSGLAVTVLEGSPRLGGKLAVSEVAGVRVDSGAEALLALRPEGTGLIGELGLSGELQLPGTTAAGIWTRGSVRPLPRRQFMGVPADLGELAATGILSPDGIARARQDLSLPGSGGERDESVTSKVGGRFGQELVDRLVDPLLGGVYAGRCEDLSFEATLPALAQAARKHSSLTEAAAELVPLAGANADAGPACFTTLADGLGTLPPAVAAASGATIQTSAMVRELTRTAAGWRLTVGSAHSPEYLEADAVIIAVPAVPASRLAGTAGPRTAAALAEIRYASMAVVTLAYTVALVSRLRPPGAASWSRRWTSTPSRRSRSARSSGRTCGAPRATCTSSGARSAASGRRRAPARRRRAGRARRR